MKNLLIALGLFIFTYYSYADYPWSISEAWRVQVQWGSNDISVFRSYLKMSPDGKELIHFKPTDSTVVFYDALDGKKLRTVKTKDKVYGAIFTKDGKKVLYRKRNGMIEIASYPEFEVEKTLYSANGDEFIYYEESQRAVLNGYITSVIDIEKDVVLEQIKINENYFDSPVYSISTNKVAYITTSNINTQSEACYVNVIDEDGKLEFQYSLRCGSAILQDRVRKIGVSNNGNLLVFHGKDLQLYIYDFRTGELKKSGSVGGQIEVIEFTADDKQIYMGNDAYGISRINVETLQMESLIGGGTVRHLCFNSDTTAMYDLSSSDLEKYNIKRKISNIEETELKLVINYTQVDGILNIELNDYSQIRAITVSNMQGKVLTSVNTFASNNTQIDLFTYPKGTYFITILTIDNQREIIKINI
jgi:WD40 repeat protein